MPAPFLVGIELDRMIDGAMVYYSAVVHSIAINYGMLHIEEDLEQEARVALWLFSLVWDETLNNNFQKASYQRVKGAVMDYVRRAGYGRRSQCSARMISLGTDLCLRLLPGIPSHLEFLLETESKRMPIGWDALLSVRERNIVLMRFVGDQTVKAVGDAMGITQSRVSQILFVALNKARIGCGVPVRQHKMTIRSVRRIATKKALAAKA
jgi:RNA polymerase sigma factor (sigma-70 family)